MAKTLGMEKGQLFALVVIVALVIGFTAYYSGVLQAIRFTEATVAAGQPFSLEYVCDVAGCSGAVQTACGGISTSCVTAIKCSIDGNIAGTSSGFETSFMTVPATIMTVTAPNSAGSHTIACGVYKGGTNIWTDTRTVTVQAQAACQNKCNDVNILQCTGDTTYVKCALQSNGCYDWQTSNNLCSQNAQAPLYYGCRSGQCVIIQPQQSCPAVWKCDGNTKYLQTADCKETQAQFCDYGCQNGGCLQPPASTTPDTNVVVGGSGTNGSEAQVGTPTCADKGECSNRAGQCVVCPTDTPSGTTVGDEGGAAAKFDFNQWSQDTLGVSGMTLGILIVIILAFVLILAVLLMRK